MLVCAALVAAGAGRCALAQSEAGALAGRVTDLHSRPMDGATVVVRNQATGVEARTVTARNGTYRFANLGPGEYSLTAEAQNLGQGRLDGIVIVAGHEARVQAALEFQPLPPAQPSTEIASIPSAVAPQVLHVVSVVQTKAVAVPMVPASAVPRDSPAPVHPAVSVDLPMERLATAQPAARPTPAPLARQAERPETMASMSSPPVLATVSVAPGVLAVRGTVLPVSLHPAAIAAAPRLLGPGAALVRIAALSARATALSASLHNDEASQQGTATFTAAQIQALPLAEGRWEPLVLDTTTTAPDDSQEQLPTEGREAAAGIAVDGVTTRLAFGAQTTGRAHGRVASLIGPGSSDAALREVQTAMGNAEELTGRSLGGHARVETERGGDTLHGQAFLFDRQGLWGAQNPFTQWVQQTAPETATTVPVFTGGPLTPQDRAVRWGLSAGGRVRRSKVYWFASVGDTNRNDPGVSSVKHPENFFAQPSNDQAQVLAARLGLSAADPVGEGLAKYSSMLQTLDGLLGAAPRTGTNWTGFGRVDGAFHRDRYTIEGTGVQTDAPGGGLSRASETYGTHSYGASHTSEQWVLGRWAAPLAPNLLSVTQGSFGHHDHTNSAETPSPFEQSLNVNAWGQLPQIAVDTRYGFTIGNPARFGPGSYPDERIYLGQEQLAWTHGKLLVSAGAEVSHNADTTTFLRNQTGSYSYASVENFASDALAFAMFGLNGELNPLNQHNCDQTGRVWRDSGGTLRGLGDLPCYAFYTQTMGPAKWWLSTNDWAAYTTVQRRIGSKLTLSAALRWEREQAPPPLALVSNPGPLLSQQLPDFGNEWGPRAGVAWNAGRRGPVLRLGYGMYFSRTPNAALETALTQTGSPKGDLNYFMRPTDNINDGVTPPPPCAFAGLPPPFPCVLVSEPTTIVKPAVVEFAPTFHNGEIHQAVASVEETLPGSVHVTASAAVSLGRHLPLTLDANVDPTVNPGTITYAIEDGNGSGPLKTPRIKVPFYATWPGAANGGRLYSNYQQIDETFSRANSTYEAASLLISRAGRGGITVHARYTYAHAMDWNPDSGGIATQPSVFDPSNLQQEYGTSDLDIRHSATVAMLWEPRWRVHARAGLLANGWALSTIGSFRSGLPYTMRTAGSLAEEFDTTGAAIVGLSTGMNGYGGDNRVYGVGRNTFRYPQTWKADLRLSKRFHLGEMRELELLAQSFNFFNHQNVTELETVGYSLEPGDTSGGFPTLNFLTGLKTNQTEFGQPLNVNATDFYRPRQIEFGLRMRF
jgi:hypothetical protein